MTTNQDNIKLLEKIYGRTLKASETYRNASKNVHNRPLTLFFEKAAVSHEKFAEELKNELSQMGSNVSKKSSLNISTDNFWSDFASIIVRRNESAMLKNCLKAEEKAVVLYDEAVESNDIEGRIKEKIRGQRDYAKSLSAEVSSLEKQYASD
ncbi:uncharacterized protein (TIGR02284 family) [Catalinimonas alkaloidigena]|uniref:DUF2383 domain-containing protein n=1 Tax=Catalinimonas alkaloidigena TaxID=1075417 RepID=UPI002405C9B6|nr:DUF2383 domain-containing protein [Catalinimonas alkaloidigena]MDF9799032.1 uncharacterized protein (TIGR02284 family) [Catalinimonas alkaloidigena]